MTLTKDKQGLHNLLSVHAHTDHCHSTRSETQDMINNLRIPNIRLFVFGTLRVGGKLDYYMEGSSPLGLYYTRGQLMESAIGSAYIDFSVTNVRTIGELHHVNYYCLQRINHLEITWGEFPQGYELHLVPIWPYHEGENGSPEEIFNEDKKTIALCYKRRDDSKVLSGDWIKRPNVIDEIGRALSCETERTFYHTDVIDHLVKYLGQYS